MCCCFCWCYLACSLSLSLFYLPILDKTLDCAYDMCVYYIYIYRERERERESRSHFGSSRERFKDRRGPFCLFLSFSACFGPPCSKPGALPSSLAPSSSAAIAEQRPDNPCPERAHRFSRRDRCARLLYGDRCCDRPWGLPLQLPDASTTPRRASALLQYLLFKAV